MRSRSRHPGGTPSGGRFAATDHAEADTGLVDKPAPAEPGLEPVLNALRKLSRSEGLNIDEHCLELAAESAVENLKQAQERTIASYEATEASIALNSSVRPTTSMLYYPLTPTELALRTDSDGYVTAIVPVERVRGLLPGYIPDELEYRVFGQPSTGDTKFERTSDSGGSEVYRARSFAGLAGANLTGDDRAEFDRAVEYAKRAR